MNRLLKWIFLPLCILTFFYVTNAQSDSKRLSVKELVKKLKEENSGDIILLDVRTPAEFDQGSIEQAINVDWYADDFEERISRLSKEKKIYVFCRSGKRSAKAVNRMREFGFLTVSDVAGGYKAWLEN